MESGNSRQLDATLLNQWYGEYALRLTAFAFGLTRDRNQADEVVQATFAKAFQSGGSVHPGSEKAWLFQVAFNEAMVLRRQAGVHRRATEKLGTRLKEGNFVQPDENLIQAEVANRVRLAVRGLPQDQRDIIDRRMRDEQTFQQIAEELDLPLGTVLTRMRAALKRLRAALKQDDRNTND